MTDDNNTKPQTRRERLAAIAARYTEEIHDPRAESQLTGTEAVSRFAAVTSEGSPESGFSTNGNLLVADSAAELAGLLKGEAIEGWLAHGRAWDFDADWSPDGNLDQGYAAYVRPADGEVAWSEGDPTRPVWICTFQHRHGLDAWAAVDEDAAYASLAVPARSFWSEAVECDRGLRDDDRPPLPGEAPTDDRTAVESYFAVMADAPQPEFFSIERQEVIGAGGH